VDFATVPTAWNSLFSFYYRFSPGITVSSTNITEILLNVVLNTINLNLHLTWFSNKKKTEKPIINFDGS
jgi:hypothetical protein